MENHEGHEAHQTNKFEKISRILNFNVTKLKEGMKRYVL